MSMGLIMNSLKNYRLSIIRSQHRIPTGIDAIVCEATRHRAAGNYLNRTRGTLTDQSNGCKLFFYNGPMFI